MNKTQLRELYDNQCFPCVGDGETCGGDKAKAKSWLCFKFVNGCFILTVGGVGTSSHCSETPN